MFLWIHKNDWFKKKATFVRSEKVEMISTFQQNRHFRKVSVNKTFTHVQEQKKEMSPWHSACIPSSVKLPLFKLNIIFYFKCYLDHNCNINLNWNNTQFYSSVKQCSQLCILICKFFSSISAQNLRSEMEEKLVLLRTQVNRKERNVGKDVKVYCFG